MRHLLFGLGFCILFLLGTPQGFSKERSKELTAYADKLDRHFGLTTDSAEIWIAGMIKLAQEEQDWESTIAAYRFQGMYAFISGDFTNSINSFQHVYELLSLHPIENEWYHYYYYLSAIYGELNDYEKTFEYIQKAEKHCEQNGWFDKIIRVYNRLIFQYATFDIDKGWKIAKKVEQLLNSIDYEYHDYDLAQLHHAHSRLYLHERKLDESLNSLRIADSICVELEWVSCRINLLLDAATVRFEKEEYNKAKDILNQAMGLCEEYKAPKEMAIAKKVMANIQAQTENWDEAIALYHEAYQVTSEMQLRKYDLNIVKGLSKAYQAKGEFKKAIHWANVSDSLREAVNDDAQKAQLAILDNQKKVNQLLAGKEQEKKSLEYQFWVAIAVFLVAIVIFGIVVKMQKNQSRRKELEKHLLLKQQEQLGNQIEMKNQQLVAQFRYLNQKKQLIDNTTERLSEIKDNLDKKSQQTKIQSIIDNMDVKDNDKTWEEFETHFIQVHKSFYDRLQEKHPRLSPSERKLCAFLKLKMSTKEIAEITFQSISSVDTSRARLRKKLNINDSGQSLSAYIASF